MGHVNLRWIRDPVIVPSQSGLQQKRKFGVNIASLSFRNFVNFALSSGSMRNCKNSSSSISRSHLGSIHATSVAMHSVYVSMSKNRRAQTNTTDNVSVHYFDSIMILQTFFAIIMPTFCNMHHILCYVVKANLHSFIHHERSVYMQSFKSYDIIPGTT